jgi:N-dimethylarginine dimethylaminohydrolase
LSKVPIFPRAPDRRANLDEATLEVMKAAYRVFGHGGGSGGRLSFTLELRRSVEVSTPTHPVGGDE